MKQIDAIVTTCIEKGYVTPEKAPWLCYALEKRITSLLTFIPLCIIGLLLTNPATFLSFYFTFYLLRSLTNGWHAKTFLSCLVSSIMGEFVFLGVLSKLRHTAVIYIFVSISVLLLWMLSPYNHPNMRLAEDEIAACKYSVRKRLVLLALILIALEVLHMEHCTIGIQIGIIMVAFTLLLAYIENIKR